MARIGLVGPSYVSQSVNADAQMSMNWYAESLEDGSGKTVSALYPTPGTTLFAALSDFPIRGMIAARSGTNARNLIISGTTAFEVNSAAQIFSRGTGLVDDGNPVSMAAGTTQILIASGGTAYVFNMNTLAFTTIGAGVLTNVLKVGYSDGFFIALLTTGAIQASAPLDATTWPGASVSTQNIFADTLLSMIVDHRELWVFGSARSVVYFDSGNSPFPFDVVPSGTIEQGIIAGNSAVRLDNSVFWLGGDERGNGVAWRAQGYTPTRVSNHAVEFAWSQYSTISDAIAYSYQDQGHSFWVIYFPTAQHTWVYDVATAMWHERGFWNVGSQTFGPHRSAFHMAIYGKHLVGDSQSGNVSVMSINTFTDVNNNPIANGNPINRIRRAPHISTENEWIFHHQLQIDMETGVGTGLSIPQTGVLSNLILQDASLVLWAISIDDTNYLFHSTSGGTGAVGTVFINDTTPGTSWQLGINTTGLLTLTSVAFNASYPTAIGMYSSTLGVIVGISVLNGLLKDTRGPQISLRWSDDGGHTWSNYHTVDVGNAGQYKTRAMFRRLGRSRDRVYEVSGQDAVPYRLLEADLIATPGFKPSERISKEYTKVT